MNFNYTNGLRPEATLIADAAGNLYGTTTDGGVSGDGTVFKVNPTTHVLTTLVSFDSAHGTYPECSLIADAAGNLFGTTTRNGPGGHGTVFELPANSNALITLASFDGSNGGVPVAGLIADGAGNLYGTTESPGTVFELSGTGFVVPEPADLSAMALGGLALLARCRPTRR